MVGLNPSGGVYPSGSVVTATATPSIGWYFVNWTGDASSSTNPLNVSITTNKVIIANFQPSPTYTLNTSVSGNGLVSLNPAGGTYVSNTIVTATALPATNWLFGYWTGDTNTTVNPLSIVLDENFSLEAVFVQRRQLRKVQQTNRFPLAQRLVLACRQWVRRRLLISVRSIT